MVALSLKICVRHCNVVKTMQFEPSTAVYDACRVIRERVPEAQTGQGSHWLFAGFWNVFVCSSLRSKKHGGSEWYTCRLACMFQLKCLKCLLSLDTLFASCVWLRVMTVTTPATEWFNSSSWPSHVSDCAVQFTSHFSIHHLQWSYYNNYWFCISGALFHMPENVPLPGAWTRLNCSQDPEQALYVKYFEGILWILSQTFF